RLRIEHEGALSLRMDRRGRPIRFDPISTPSADAIVILTGAWPEQLVATRDAVRAGQSPTVVAPPPIIDWLSSQGAVRTVPTATEIDGLTVEQRAFSPIPYATPLETVFKLQSALRRPDRAARRLVQRVEMPRCAPMVTRVRFPDGNHLVHASLCLHDGTPDAWFAKLVADWARPEWLLLGVDFGQGDAAIARAGDFNARHILVTDLLSDLRRSLGLPTELLTPVRDNMLNRGLAADVFVSGAGLRYE
ncbi:MAG TPA: hypothetical protein DFR83_20370, partial [Deltaproteobacteria bacterium]|nr:hypothetical protein [Deltaproteobacteria bacterium]